MKFVLLSSTHTLPDSGLTSSRRVVEYDSMTQLMEDLAQNSFWVIGETSSFRVDQVLTYDTVDGHL